MSNVKSLAKLRFFSESVRTENHWIVQKHSRSEVLYGKSALRNFSKSTGKHLCQSRFLIKLQAKACKFMKKEALAQVFSWEFYNISQNTLSYRNPLVAASDNRLQSKLTSLIWKTQNSAKISKFPRKWP